MLELGKGFSYVGNQVRLTLEEDHFYPDLVFYNRLLRCFVIIDLKIGKVSHQDIGQMQMYVNYYDREIKQDELAVGILAMEDARNYYVDLGRTRGILPKSELIPGETLKMGSSVKVYVSKVEATNKGPLVLCTRKHYGFVKRLFESVIPELQDGTLEIHAVAREAGVRSKVAVSSTNERIDAIGTCIGERGSRIASILSELNGEKVDLVLWSEDDAEFVKNALSPAKDVIVSIIDDEKERIALAIVNDENLSLAIGKKGVNIRLASKLTKYKINVKTFAQVQEEGNK